MLVELLVENVAVVDRIRVRFYPGFNTLTGETGSGKSIVVDALGLLFGGRSSAEMVRSGCDRARVSGLFELPDDPGLRAVLEAAGIELEDAELLIEREVLASGKSRAYVANRPATAALLRDLAVYLGDIHGQHDQQRLFSPDTQLQVLDEFADTGTLRVAVADLYRCWRDVSTQLRELDRTEQDKLRLLDLLAFQRKEIESAKLVKGEDEALELERRKLQNVNKLGDAANIAYAALYDSPESSHKLLRTALKKLDELVRIDESLREVLDILQPADVAIQEASLVLRDYLGGLEADPDRLEAVEHRLSSIDRLKRKYGRSIDEILDFLADVRRQVEAMESSAERRVELEKQRTQFGESYQEAAGRLTATRQKAARTLSEAVEKEMHSLAMERATFRIQIGAAGWSVNGADAVQFLISANLGEELRPLERVASGGELSRVSLALKTATMAATRRTPATAVRTLVFDEVDAGIGGDAAVTVGQRLKKIAAANQVLCVTHLAQIAGSADHHYSVEKRAVDGRTVASIQELQGEARTREIGRMLSGQRLTPEALKYAEQLIRSGGA